MSIENGFISSETMSFLFLNDFSGIESIMSFKKQKYGAHHFVVWTATFCCLNFVAYGTKIGIASTNFGF